MQCERLKEEEDYITVGVQSSEGKRKLEEEKVEEEEEVEKEREEEEEESQNLKTHWTKDNKDSQTHGNDLASGCSKR